MAKTKGIFKKITVAAIATVGIMLAGNSLQAQAETIKPEEVTLAVDAFASTDATFGNIEELPDGSWIGSDSLLPEEAEENEKLDEAENMTQPSDAEDASDDATTLEETADNEQPQLDILMLTTQEIKPVVVEALDTNTTTGTDTATADADASVDVPSQDITDADADAVEAGEDKILDEGFAVDGVDTDEVETPSTSESKVSDVTNVTEDTDEDDWLYADADADDEELVPEFKGDSVVESKSTVNVDDDDDWMYVDFDSEPEVKGDDIITPEEPMVPEEPQPQPVVPETPILTEPTVQPTQTPVVLGDSLWTAPKTGDTIAMIAIYIIATLLAAGVIVLNLQRQKRRMWRTRCSPMIRPDHLIDH